MPPPPPEPGGVPVTWPELLIASREAALYAEEALSPYPTQMETARTIAVHFASAATTLSRCTVVLGPEACRPSLARLEPYVARAVGEFETGVDCRNTVRALGLLSYLNTTLCCGASVVSASGLEARLLPQFPPHKKALTEREIHTLALAALAANLPELVPDLLGGGALPKRIRPGASFQFNVHGFVRYVAASMLARADAAAIEPAWRSFVDSFPRKLASNTLGWVDLLWAARAIMVHFEHRPAETVAAALHDLVR